MKFLIDANLSPRVAEALNAAGYEAVHVGDMSMLNAADETILDWASERGGAVVTADSDFGALLSIRRTSSPSVIHLRDVADQPPERHIALLVKNLPVLEAALRAGAIISLSPAKIRIRDLPIK